MTINRRIQYWRRVFSAYIFGGASQLSFWHESPQINPRADVKKIGEYYMVFSQKADYSGPFDVEGIPLLDYRGAIGKQYNPIAISQYGLAHYNVFKKTADAKSREIFINQADWLVENLEANEKGIKVWMHKFDWEYKQTLKNPWYSGLAQGQGISLLLRAHEQTGDEKYVETAKSAFISLTTLIENGGTQFIDDQKNVWIEEYIVNPPTHILNGFIWALWGVYDYYLATSDVGAKELWEKSITTLKINLPKYDSGFWSLYDLSGLLLKNPASRFYHKLHIVQLEIMHSLTQETVFLETAKKWRAYEQHIFLKNLALVQKMIFKVFYY